MEIEVTNDPSKDDNDFVISKTREYNLEFVQDDTLELSVFLREGGSIVGGLVGRTYLDWLHVENFWVDEAYRKKSYGSEILEKAESEAKRRGCHGSTLDTFSFQALEFYEKNGYSVIGTLPKYCGKHERYYLSKVLV